MIADGLFNAAVGWGRLTFFVAIGLLLFLWPRYSHDNPATLNGYVLVILYLMSPVEQIMAWLPYMNWAMESVRQIENLGLLLDQCAPEAPATAPVARWQQIEFVDVTHAYRREGRPHGFVLGPFQLTLSPGEIIFVIGGNGSGKTTLAKLITGLYVPETGRVRLDGRSIVSENREGYRQLFSAVFDDAMVFDNLWGIAAEGRDQTAHEHLRRLQLDHLVSVSNGAFSTTALSRGQRKRLALLTAYLEDRLIYVFDEWAADQDPVFRKFFYLNLLPELKARGKTVVAITHDDRYFGTADRVIKLDEGKVVEIMRHESIEEYQCEIV
jgi:putative ATP-binding cassette transporter